LPGAGVVERDNRGIGDGRKGTAGDGGERAAGVIDEIGRDIVGTGVRHKGEARAIHEHRGDVGAGHGPLAIADRARLDRAVRLCVDGYPIGVTRANGSPKRKRPVRVYRQIVAAVVGQREATADKAGDCTWHGFRSPSETLPRAHHRR